VRAVSRFSDRGTCSLATPAAEELNACGYAPGSRGREGNSCRHLRALLNGDAHAKHGRRAGVLTARDVHALLHGRVDQCSLAQSLTVRCPH
jgi:hypothetical protein